MVVVYFDRQPLFSPGTPSEPSGVEPGGSYLRVRSVTYYKIWYEFLSLYKDP